MGWNPVPVTYLDFRFSTSFKQGVPWHPGNYRVWIHSETHTWHDKNIQSYLVILSQYCCQSWGGKTFLFSGNVLVKMSCKKDLKVDRQFGFCLTYISDYIGRLRIWMIGCRKFDLVIVHFCWVIDWYLVNIFPFSLLNLITLFAYCIIVVLLKIALWI